MARRLEETHEFEGRIEFTSERSRLVEDCFTGVRYWVPKSQTVDFNLASDDTYMFVVTDWWNRKKDDFIVKERE